MIISFKTKIRNNRLINNSLLINNKPWTKDILKNKLNCMPSKNNYPKEQPRSYRLKRKHQKQRMILNQLLVQLQLLQLFQTQKSMELWKPHKKSLLVVPNKFNREKTWANSLRNKFNKHRLRLKRKLKLKLLMIKNLRLLKNNSQTLKIHRNKMK